MNNKDYQIGRETEKLIRDAHIDEKEAQLVAILRTADNKDYVQGFVMGAMMAMLSEQNRKFAK